MTTRLLTITGLLMPVFIFAGITGKITGVATDQATGDPLVGVNVLVEGTVLGAATGADGSYHILNVPVGLYTVRANYIGFRSLVVQEVAVSADLTTQLNFSLETAALQADEIVVTAERPLIRRDATNTNIIRTGEEIDALPTRGIAALASQIAGVVREERSGVMNIRGGRGEETAVYIDGVFVNDPYNYAMRLYLPNEAIQEISVQTGGFNAEYGEAMSGIVAITTNSGSERYSGSFQAITDGFLSDTKKTLGAYGYGYSEYVLALGGPIIPGSRHTFFASFTSRNIDDRTPSWGWAENETKPTAFEYINPVDSSKTVFDFSSAQIPGNSQEEISYSGKIKIQLGNTMDLKASVVGTNRTSSLMTPIKLFNPEYATEYSAKTNSFNVTLTHAPSPNTYYDVKVNYFDTFRKEVLPIYGDNLYEYGDPAKNPFKVDHALGETSLERIGPDFFAPGTQVGFGTDDYFKNRTSYLGFDFDLTHQMGQYHTIKTGFDYKYHTMREYRILSPAKLASVADLTKAERWRNADVRFYGYDIEGNETNEGDYLKDVKRDETGKITSGFDKQAPYHPIIMSGFLQDKIEFSDLVLNLGIRYDLIDANAWQFKELEATFNDDGTVVPGTGAFGGDEIFNSKDTQPSTAHTFISPRLGVSFPVTDRTIFHAQYGKFYQSPQLGDLYLSPFYLDAFVNRGGYFTTLDNPNLEPTKTTAYEVGLQQRLGAYAAIQLTAFYKEIEGQVQILNVATDLTNLAFSFNGDFGTVRGFDFIFTLNRMRNIYATFNYELQYAVGTGSATDSNFDIAWQGGGGREHYPKFTQPLDFEQRHTGTLNVDYRLGPNEGPAFMGMNPLENTSVNFIYTFTSGNPYTRMQIFNSQPHSGRYDNDRNVGQKPVSAINGVMSPWTNRVDLRLDRSINLLGNSSVSVYLWVLNLFNTRNVREVWLTTGLPDDSGYRSTTGGAAYFNALSDNDKAAFLMREIDYNYFGIPRQVRLGLKVKF